MCVCVRVCVRVCVCVCVCERERERKIERERERERQMETLFVGACMRACSNFRECPCVETHQSETDTELEVGGWGRDPKKCTGRD